ncbi:MAG: hypothetical protein M1358_17815 [Chloroflexi bacterium]|nr:hypothetical protein [Chloroflexota bacterium]
MESRWKRRPPRLKGWDYASAGAYLVTFVVKHRAPCLSINQDGKPQFTGIGIIVERSWKELPLQFSNLTLDEMMARPDPVSAILILQGDEFVSGPLINQGSTNQQDAGRALTRNECVDGTAFQESELWILTKNPQPVLGKIIWGWKARSIRWIRRSVDSTFAWQDRYYEHIIRGEEELNQIRQYIIDNPAKWKGNHDELPLPLRRSVAAPLGANNSRCVMHFA